MIIGNICNCEKYFNVHNDFKEAFEILKSLGKDTSVGKIQGKNVSGNVFDTNTADASDDGNIKPFEAHKRFIDIHYIISENESFGYEDIEYLSPITEYREDNDCILYEGEINKVMLHEGDFCIVFPEDAHIPAMGNGNRVKRCVLKVKI